MPQLFGKRNITVSEGFNTCSVEVIRQTCDKSGYRNSRGQKFRCVAQQGEVEVKFDDGCPLTKGTYTDNVRCRKRRDDDIVVGCDLVVPIPK